MTTFTWIITGATRGFGRSIAQAALSRGEAVVAAVRRPEAMADLGAEYPDHLEVVRFDATSVDGVGAVVEAATSRFGRIDVLVSNAGRGYVGAAEEVTEAELRESMELHLFVPVALAQAVLPVMRRQGGGTIVQMSSQGGRRSFPGVGAYTAAKFALEGWSEALEGEVAPFGVRVMIVEPSRFRTAFNEAGVLAFAEVSDVYRDILADLRTKMAAADGVQEGDPDAAATVIADLVHAGSVPLRLPLGAEAVANLDTSYRTSLKELEEWAAVARAVDFRAVAS